MTVNKVLLVFTYWFSFHYCLPFVMAQGNDAFSTNFHTDYQNLTGHQPSSSTSNGYHINAMDSPSLVKGKRGETVNFYCDIYGNPVPNITWYLDGVPIRNSRKYEIHKESWGSKFVIHDIQPEDERTYLCVGENLMDTLKKEISLVIDDGGSNKIPGVIDSIEPSKTDQCQKFSSQVCAGFLKNKIIHVSHKHDQASKEMILFRILNEIKKNTEVKSEECVSEIAQLLCYYNFPICLENPYSGRYTSGEMTASYDIPMKIKYSAFQLCRDDCSSFKVKCSNLFDKIKASLSIEDRQYFINCKRLSLGHEDSCIKIRNGHAILPNMTQFIKKQKEMADKDFEELDTSQTSKYWPILITFASIFGVTGFLILICVFCRCAFLQNFGRSTRFSSEFQPYSGNRRSSFFRHSDFKSHFFQNLKNFRNSSVMINNNNSSIIPIMPNGCHNINSPPFPMNHPSVINNNSLTNENPGSFDSSYGDSFTKAQNPYPSHMMSDLNKSPMIQPMNQNYFHSNNNNNKSSNKSIPQTNQRHHYQTVFGQAVSSNSSDFEQKSDKNLPCQPYTTNTQRGWSNYAKFNQFNMSPNLLQAGNNNTTSSDEHTPTSIELNSDIIDYNYNSIKFDTNLGHGLFGPMYNGEFQLKNGTYENGNDTLNYCEINRLFVKTLLPGSSGSLQVEFINEANVMNQLKHVNLLSLMGVSIHQLPWCMLFDISGYHELPEYFINGASGTLVNPEGILVQMSLQISSGLVYLSEKNFAHQDISARNVLINPFKSYNNEIGFTLKLTNLAFGRNRYATCYQSFLNKSMDMNNNMGNQIFLPIRWMSPESLISGKFTLESDIWSFGILIWELLTNCKLMPYFNINESILVDYIIENGNKIFLPKLTYNIHNDSIKFLINCLYECLNLSSIHRPKFTRIHEQTYNFLYNPNVGSSGKTKKSLTESVNSSLTHTTISSNSTVSSTKNFAPN